MKISEAFDEYLEYLEIKGVSRVLLSQYERTKKYWIGIVGNSALEDIKMSDVAMFKEQLLKGRQNNTVIEYICRVRMVLKFATIKGYGCGIKWEQIPVPKRDPVIPSYLTAEEVAKMVDCACNIRAKFVVSLFYGSGIRLAELISLNRGQIVDRHFTVIGKGKKVRACCIDSRTEELMKRYLATRCDNGDALVATRWGTRMTPTNVQMIVHNAAEAAGIDYKHVHPHALRHSFATNFIHNNGNIVDLANLMGHSSVNTTKHYTHIEPQDLQAKYDLYHTF